VPHRLVVLAERHERQALSETRRCQKLVANPVCPIMHILWKGKE